MSIGPGGPGGDATAYGVGADRDTSKTVLVASDPSDGQLLWKATHSEGSEIRFKGQDAMVAADPLGERVFVTIAGDPTPHRSIVTAAFDAEDGTLLWDDRHATDGGQAIPSAIEAGPHGKSVFVTGSTDTDEGDRDFLTMRLDAATGEKLWTRHADIRGDDEAPNAMAISPSGDRVAVTGSGNEYVMGCLDEDIPNAQAFTVLYDAGDGTELGRDVAEKRGGGPDAGLAITFDDEDEGIYVAGVAHAPGSCHQTPVFLVLGLSAVDAVRVWEQRIGVAGPWNANGLVSEALSFGEKSIALETYASATATHVIATGPLALPEPEATWGFVVFNAAEGQIQREQRVLETEESFHLRAAEIAEDGSMMWGIGHPGSVPIVKAVDLRTGYPVWSLEEEIRPKALALDSTETYLGLGLHLDYADANSERLGVGSILVGGMAEETITMGPSDALGLPVSPFDPVR